jgi:hypothetical protein
VSRRGAKTHVGGNTLTSPNPGRAAPGLDDACRHLELVLSMTERASSEVSFPSFYESGNALNHSIKPFANAVRTVMLLLKLLPGSERKIIRQKIGCFCLSRQELQCEKRCNTGAENLCVRIFSASSPEIPLQANSGKDISQRSVRNLDRDPAHPF